MNILQLRRYCDNSLSTPHAYSKECPMSIQTSDILNEDHPLFIYYKLATCYAYN